MQHVVLTRGLPASGKSTWAIEEVKAKGWKRINRDLLRLMVDGGEWSRENESLIVSARDTLLLSFLRKGHSVIIDDTNFDDRTCWKAIFAHLEALDIDVTLSEKSFPVDVDVAIERDSKREGTARVGAEVITRMWKQHVKTKPATAYSEREAVFGKKVVPELKQDEHLPKTVICDLDGTLALMGNRSPYDASKCDVVDKPNPPVVEAVMAFHRMGYKIIFLSGRDEKDRPPTERFITRAVPELADAPLLMRARGDMRKDTIIKREIWDAHIAGRFNVVCAIDDRPSVVRMWRYEVGIPVFAVNDKEF